MTAYDKYLKSHHWRDLRSKALKDAGGRCALCQHPHDLEPHHLRYGRLFDVTLTDLIVLCSACHSRVHWWIDHREVGGETSIDRRFSLIARFLQWEGERREQHWIDSQAHDFDCDSDKRIAGAKVRTAIRNKPLIHTEWKPRWKLAEERMMNDK